MENILVTGAAGFIGSHICLLLLEKGYNVLAFDSFINSSPKSLDSVIKILEIKNINARERINIIKGDLKRKSDINEIFSRNFKLGHPIKAVIHLAGLKSVFESTQDPLSYWENNTYGSINLLRAMKNYGCRTIVFSGSATVYKAKSDKLLNEEDPCEPINPYGNTKLNIERILNDLHNSEPSKWRILSLRYFNPVGAHKSGLIGENPMGNPNNIYPRITQVAIGKISEIKIFGSDWPTPDGTGIRDYLHVMDLAEGHLSALNYLLEENPQILTLNLGTGKGTSVLELIKIFEMVNNVQIPFSFAERRRGDNAFVVADNSLAKKTLKWLPERNVEDICKDGWNWQQKNPNGYRN